MGVLDAAKRELMEELDLPDIDRTRVLNGIGLSVLGILNDDSSPVGRRHFAYILRYEVSRSASWNSPKKGEKSIAKLHWLSPSEGGYPIWRFEYWSQICVRKYFPYLAQSASAYRLVRGRQLNRASIICVIGSIGSGKTEAVNVLNNRFGFRPVNSGRVLAKLLKQPPVTNATRSAFQQKALRFIQRPDGPKRLAAAIASEVLNGDERPVVIDGLRQRTTFNELCKAVAPNRVAVVCVHTLPDIAFQFYLTRSPAKASFDDFLALRDAEVERDLVKFLRISDAAVYNWVGWAAYTKTIRTLFRAVKVGSMRIQQVNQE
jgi:dephospho-CoA kinase